MRYREDETWHRLREWTGGSEKSERLAAQVLSEEGFTDVDPSHPLGGPDGGKDITCTKDGKKWIAAVYFPRGQKQFMVIKNKFEGDLNGAEKNEASGVVFVTNQEISLSQREILKTLSGNFEVDLVHLERLSTILDRPHMVAVRAQFLDIDFSNDELKEAFRADLSKVESNITGFQTGGDTFCYWMLYDFDLTRDYAKQFCLIKRGEFPLYDVHIRIRDMDRSIDILEEEWGNINSPAVFKFVKWSLPDHAYYRIFFNARNGQWHQDLQLIRSQKENCWLAVTRVSDTRGRPRFQDVGQDFIAKFGDPIWRD